MTRSSVIPGSPSGAAPLDAGACAEGVEAGTRVVAGVDSGGWSEWLSRADVFTNQGNYMPRVHCMQTAAGEPDWFWIALLIGVTLGVIAWYVRIYGFWRQCYFAERPEDRNPRMMELANIFFWCAICGYAMSVLMFVWPAYRLLALFLIVLNVWSWRFVMRIGDFRSALQAKRFERELRESLEKRAHDLERQVALRTEELEVARHEAEDANRAKSEFLANMSHEIRTPLNAILGFAQVLAEEGDDPDARASHLGTIRRNGEHLLTVISDVLDLSKIEAGQMQIERVVTPLPDLLLDIRTLLHERAGDRGNSLEIELATPVPCAIETDPTRLRQVLINLVGNAIKFTENGRVRVIASVVQGEGGREMLEIAVRDTGIGLTEEQIGHIFKPFRQADGSTTRKYGGTGLGLTISLQLAERLGGGLHAEGRLGEGSTFTLRIDPGDLAGVERVSRLVRTATQPDVTAPPERLEARVLLAEDGPDNRRLIQHMMGRAGVEIECAEHGALAVEAVQRAADEGVPYDAVLMDMQMPVMDGVEATLELRRRGFDLPIIALTANAMPSDRERCMSAGFDGYVTKPARRAEILSAIREQMELRRRAA
ncbi:MAG: hypothetical protein Tsb0013_01820 [Phycisphaerales bacterium]